MTETLRVGRRTIAMDQARDWVKPYLVNEAGTYAYPFYDGFRTNDDPDVLCDGDLLAPVLLNVSMKIVSFGDLKTVSGIIEEALGQLPKDLDLTDAGDDVLPQIGACFAALDSDKKPRNVQGTTLAKILHRKRPQLLPIYDRNVWNVYVGGDGPIPQENGRTWERFMTLLASAIRDDLRQSAPEWDQLTALAPDEGPPVSRLRVLDIVAWNVGGKQEPEGE